MTAIREENGSWTSQFWYKDIYGKRKHKCKRGFGTKVDAEAFELDYTNRARGSMDMRLADFVDVYAEDVKPTIREYTWATREYIINDKIIPKFGTKRMRDITVLDVIDWQNEILAFRKENGEPYSETYVRTVNSAFASIMNHAERYYGLHPNPVKKAPRIGSKNARGINIWSKEQYLRFSESQTDDKLLYTAFEVLYWTGVRTGELLALTPADIDFVGSTLRVRHSYRRLKRKDLITDPKTEKSIRQIALPEFLRDELRDFVYNVSPTAPDERIFADLSSAKLKAAIAKGCAMTGVPAIRVHDLRHSHVSLLIEMGFSAVAIGDRTGHESAEITFRYGHMFPGSQEKMADALQSYRED